MVCQSFPLMGRAGVGRQEGGGGNVIGGYLESKFLNI